MKPVRPSLKPITRFCKHAAILAERHPQGSIHSVSGTARHAYFLGHLAAETSPDGDSETVAALEVLRSTFPGAKWEVEVHVELFDPDTGDRLIPEGTGSADFVANLPNDCGVVGDLKFGAKPVDHPDTNAQLHDYALSLAIARGWRKWMTVIYQPLVDGFSWSRWYSADDVPALLAASRAACLDSDKPEPITGPHCDGCYSRSKCEAWLLPVALAPTELEPFATGGGLTKENFPRALQLVKSMKDIVKIAEAQLKSYARDVDGVSLPDGTVYAPTLAQGRRSIDLDVVDAHPELAAQLERVGAIRKGGRHEVFRKFRPGKKAESGGAHD